MKHFLRNLFLPKLALLEFHGHCCSVGKLCPTFCNCMDCMQYTRPPYPSQSPRVCSNSCALSWWCHSAISSSIIPFFFYLQFFPTSKVFNNESALCIRWPKYYSFSISPSNEYSGLISFRIDFDLPAVQGTLKRLLKHHNSKASILRCSAFFYGPSLTSVMTTGNTIALIIWTSISKVMSLLFNMLSISKVMSLLFNMLSRLVIAFLPRSKYLLISWLQSVSTVILEPRKIKSVTVSLFPPTYFPWSDGTGCHGLSFFNVKF